MTDKLREKATKRYEEARDKFSDAYVQGKASAGKAAQVTKKRAQSAAKKTAQSVETNPLAALVGGLAIGAIAAAMLPRTKKETELVGDTSRKLRKTANAAARNARDTAKQQLDTLGVNADAARAQFRDVVSKIGKAASEATSAATDTLKKR